MNIGNQMQGVVEAATVAKSVGVRPSLVTSPELEFISVEEVARKLGGVCPRTIRRLSDKGELCRPVKVGGRSMYPKQEVVDFMYRKMRARRA